MHFGIGRHACPGRWFASHEIKLILAAFLSKYDIKLKEGESRPKKFIFQIMNSPNPNAEVLIRKRVECSGMGMGPREELRAE